MLGFNCATRMARHGVTSHGPATVNYTGGTRATPPESIFHVGGSDSSLPSAKQMDRLPISLPAADLHLIVSSSAKTKTWISGQQGGSSSSPVSMSSPVLFSMLIQNRSGVTQSSAMN